MSPEGKMPVDWSKVVYDAFWTYLPWVLVVAVPTSILWMEYAHTFSIEMIPARINDAPVLCAGADPYETKKAIAVKYWREGGTKTVGDYVVVGPNGQVVSVGDLDHPGISKVKRPDGGATCFININNVSGITE